MFCMMSLSIFAFDDLKMGIIVDTPKRCTKRCTICETTTVLSLQDALDKHGEKPCKTRNTAQFPPKSRITNQISQVPMQLHYAFDNKLSPGCWVSHLPARWFQGHLNLLVSHLPRPARLRTTFSTRTWQSEEGSGTWSRESRWKLVGSGGQP